MTFNDLNIRKPSFSKEFTKLIKLALPVVGSSILHVLYNLTDMIWVGKLGTGAIAAVGTVGYYIFFGNLLLVGFSKSSVPSPNF